MKVSILKSGPLIIFILLFFSCSDSTGPDLPVLSYSPSSFNLPDRSGTVILSIRNTGSGSLEWQISSETSWFTVHPDSGAGNTDVEIHYKENVTGNPRTASISITSNGGSADNIIISQKGKPGDDNFYLAENGVTVKCPAAETGDRGTVNGVVYTKRRAGPINSSNAATTCTTGITDMSDMFYNVTAFNKDISSWDVSSVTDMSWMFGMARSFNQPIRNWNVSSVTNMTGMFALAESFNQDISGWCVSLIEAEPENFSTGSPLTEEHEPVWGTCPE